MSKWENGKRNPDYKMILKIAEIFHVKTEDIFNYNNSMLSELSDFIPDKYNENSAELTTVLNAFLATINIRDRSIFIRRYYFFEDVPVIAEEYKIKESNVRTILMRTRQKLKKYFKGMQL